MSPITRARETPGRLELGSGIGGNPKAVFLILIMVMRARMKAEGKNEQSSDDWGCKAVVATPFMPCASWQTGSFEAQLHENKKRNHLAEIIHALGQAPRICPCLPLRARVLLVFSRPFSYALQ